MILNIQDINKIVEIEKSLHDDFSKGAFFKKCFEIINPKLQKYFKSDYLFHSLYYVHPFGNRAVALRRGVDAPTRRKF